MPIAPSNGVSPCVKASTAPIWRRAVTNTSDNTNSGIAPIVILNASAPARLITSNTPFAPSAVAWCRVSSTGKVSLGQPAPETVISDGSRNQSAED